MQSGESTPNQPTATLLVVDDEPAVRRVLSMRLQLSGYRVVCAEDGEQALELFASEQPDLVVLDVMMPKLEACGTPVSYTHLTLPTILRV